MCGGFLVVGVLVSRYRSLCGCYTTLVVIVGSDLGEVEGFI